MKTFSVRISVELYKKLEELCKDSELKKGYFVRKALKQFFNNKKGKDDNRKTD